MSAGSRYDSLGSTRAAKKMHAGCRQRWLEKREVGKPSIECVQKLSDHAVDRFLVSPGLKLRGSIVLGCRTGGFLFGFFNLGAFSSSWTTSGPERERAEERFFYWEHSAVLGPPPEPGTEEPFFLSRGACRVCACGERAPERKRERERERERRRERERERERESAEERERERDRASNAYKSFRTMLLTGSWSQVTRVKIFVAEIFIEIFTEDASLLFLCHGAKKSKMTKNSNQGGGVLP